MEKRKLFYVSLITGFVLALVLGFVIGHSLPCPADIMKFNGVGEPTPPSHAFQFQGFEECPTYFGYPVIAGKNISWDSLNIANFYQFDLPDMEFSVVWLAATFLLDWLFWSFIVWFINILFIKKEIIN